MKTRLTLASLLLAAASLVIAPVAMADGKYRDFHRQDRYERSYDRGHNDGRHKQADNYRDGRRDMYRHDHRKLRHFYREHRRYLPRWNHGHHPYGGHRHHSKFRDKVIVVPPHHRRPHHSALSIVAGGAIGGIVGNTLSDGDPVATGMGVMMGAVVGDRMRRH
jgi:hypothetical protein